LKAGTQNVSKNASLFRNFYLDILPEKNVIPMINTPIAGHFLKQKRYYQWSKPFLSKPLICSSFWIPN